MKKKESEIRFAELSEKIRAQINELRMNARDLYKSKSANWGDVGEAAHVLEKLEEINQFLNQTGK